MQDRKELVKEWKRTEDNRRMAEIRVIEMQEICKIMNERLLNAKVALVECDMLQKSVEKMLSDVKFDFGDLHKEE